MRSNKWLIFGVVAVLATAIFSGCVGQPSVELEFSVGDCDLDPSGEEEGVQETTWLDDTTLEVKVYVIVNCAEEVESGSYELVNDTIILIYTCPECEDDCLKCLCGYELTYTFTNLEQMDYHFAIVRIL